MIMLSLSIKITNNCNFNCKYCLYKKRDDISIDIDKVIKFINKFDKDVKNIKITGGEPLLEFKKIKELIKNIRNTHIEIDTNASLLDEEKIDFFKKNKIRLRISLDGSKEENDNNRKFNNGEGSFDKIIEKIKLIKLKGLPLNICMTADNSNVSNLFQNFISILKYKPDEIHISYVIDKKWEDHQIKTLDTQLNKIVKIYSEYVLKRKMYISLLEPKGRVKGNISKDIVYFKDCKGYLYIDPNNNLYLCGSEYILGKKPIANLNMNLELIEYLIKNAYRPKIKPCLLLNKGGIKNTLKVYMIVMKNANYLIEKIKRDPILKKRLIEISNNSYFFQDPCAKFPDISPQNH
jgi:sulfatase maturation enzyme AslB (radical SAM superfamily)